MSHEQQALLEVMQEAYSHGEERNADFEALMTLITEKLASVIKVT